MLWLAGPSITAGDDRPDDRSGSIVFASSLPAAAAAGPAELTTCQQCHLQPGPDLLPKARWPHLLVYMHALIDQYDLGAPLSETQQRTLQDWFVATAPAQELRLEETYAAAPVTFRRTPFGRAATEPGAITGLSVCDLDRDGELDVLVSDAQANGVYLAQRDGELWRERLLVPAKAPARTEVADLDGDGALDLVVAVLGGLQPTDAPQGELLLLRAAGTGRHSSEVLLRDVPRITDVRAGDLDGDGDLDLVVALFGLFRTGGLIWLEQGPDRRFHRHDLAQRTGCSHVPLLDVDGDGDLDIAALFSQEHEQVVVYRNDGAGGFSPHVVFRGPHPMFGCSSLAPTDLDGDGDVDLLLCNGDSLDIDAHPKAWHGVAWLENRTQRTASAPVEFELHDLLRMHGAYTAVPADLDGDGDFDVVVTSMMNVWHERGRQSIVWLENDGRQQFTAHALDHTPTALLAVVAEDLDADGRVEVLAGSLHVMPPHVRPGRLSMWRRSERR